MVSRWRTDLIPIEEQLNLVTGMNQFINRLVVTIDQDVLTATQVVDQPIR